MSTDPPAPPAPPASGEPVARPATSLGMDVAFGIVLPILCLIFDPGVFRAGFDHPAAGSMRIFAYLTVPAGCAVFAAWRARRSVPRDVAALLVGVFAAGGLIAGVVGLVTLPLTVMGLVVLVGVLGLIPFGSGYVLFRAAARLYLALGERLPARRTLLLAAAGALLTVAPGALAQRAALAEYPEYDSVPAYPGARAAAADDAWRAIDSGMSLEKTLTFETDDPPATVGERYAGLLLPRHWERADWCSGGAACFRYRSATDTFYALDLESEPAGSGATRVTVRLQR